MNLDDRITYLVLGGLIGFIVGYFTRSLRSIEQHVDHVDQIVTKRDEEDGVMQTPTIANMVLLAVLVLTVWAAFSSQSASNKVTSTQDEQERTTACTQRYLSKTIEALNERTTYSTEQLQKNVQLQKDQSKFLGVLLQKPPATEEERRVALDAYYENLTDFVVVAGLSGKKFEENPYPTDEEFMACIFPSKDK